MPRRSDAKSKSTKQKIVKGTIQGLTAREIAEEAGVTQQTVSTYRNREPEVRSMLLRLKEKYAEKLDKLYLKMLDSLDLDLGDSCPDVRFRARQEVIRLTALGETKQDGTPDEVVGDMDVERALFLFVHSKKKKANVIDASVEVSVD
jgi:transcriptional regulator with XRE-family HTH domain